LLALNFLAPGDDSALELDKYLKHAKAGVDHAFSNQGVHGVIAGF